MANTPDGLKKVQVIIDVLEEALRSRPYIKRMRKHAGGEYLFLEWGEHKFQVVAFEEEKDRGKEAGEKKS